MENTLEKYTLFLKTFFEKIPRSLLQNLYVQGKRLYYDPQHNGEWCAEKKIIPVALGQYLGEVQRTFEPTPFCLLQISKYVKNIQKALIDDKGAWLFLCARDVFGAQVLEGRPDYGKPVFVFDTRKNFLGYGTWAVGDLDKKFENKQVITCVADIGSYVRAKKKK